MGSHSWLSPTSGAAHEGLAVPWPGISECPGGCPGLAGKDFSCCGLRAIFTVLSVSVISGARIGQGGEWGCQALVIVPGVGAEGQEAGPARSWVVV